MHLVGGDLGAGYFVGATTRLEFAPEAAMLFFGFGVASALAGSYAPARRAARIAPSLALKDAGDQGDPRRPPSILPAVAMIGAGTVCAVLPAVNRLPLFGYLAVGLVLAGGVAAMPWVTRLVLRPLGRAKLRVPAFEMALGRLLGAPGQASIALGGIVASTGLMIAMAVMVTSFRGAVDDWLESFLSADLYVAAASNEPLFDAETQRRLAATPGVAGIAFSKSLAVTLAPELPPALLLVRPVDVRRSEAMPRLTRRAEPARDKAREASLALVVPGLESEALLRSTLDSLSAHIAVLDGHGTIVAVNKAWRQFARESGYVGHGYGVGLNYLSVCEAGAQLSREASETAVALREIIAGRRRDFRMEYPCASSRGQRWFQARITRPEQDGSQRIVVAHEDITEVKEAHEELARLTARVMQLQDDERRSIARELHDTTAQNLLAVTLNVTRIRERLRSGTPPTDRALAETLELAEQSLQEVRTLSYLLHPPLLDVVGLGSALRWLATGFAERSGVAVEVAIGDGMESLPQDVATALFRVAQECLANVHRHSGSAWARIILSRSDQGVRLKVLDGGRGFERKEAAAPKATANVGVGLSGMRVRVEQLKGTLEVVSGASGTRVTAAIPLMITAGLS